MISILSVDSNQCKPEYRLFWMEYVANNRKSALNLNSKQLLKTSMNILFISVISKYILEEK